MDSLNYTASIEANPDLIVGSCISRLYKRGPAKSIPVYVKGWSST